jgi:hypothetical protein
MQAATQDAVLAIKEISGTIARMSEIAAAIAAAVEQQGAATQEISRNVQQAALGSTQVATNIADVNRSAENTGSASSQVLSSAQFLPEREQAPENRGRQVPGDGPGGVAVAQRPLAARAPRDASRHAPVIIDATPSAFGPAGSGFCLAGGTRPLVALASHLIAEHAAAS